MWLGKHARWTTQNKRNVKAQRYSALLGYCDDVADGILQGQYLLAVKRCFAEITKVYLFRKRSKNRQGRWRERPPRQRKATPVLPVSTYLTSLSACRIWRAPARLHPYAPKFSSKYALTGARSFNSGNFFRDKQNDAVNTDVLTRSFVPYRGKLPC